MSRYIQFCLLAGSYVAFGLWSPANADQPPPEAPIAIGLRDATDAVAGEVRYEGRTVQEWISDWDANNFQSNQKAIRVLVAVGTPAVDPLATLIGKRDKHSGLALQTLAKMGDKARDALPVLLELAADKDAADPPGWTWNVSLRGLLFSEVRKMNWAADRWVPVLTDVAEDASEPETNRTRAIHALGGMGAAGESVLNSLADNDNREIRLAANQALAAAAIAAGRSKEDVYGEIIAHNPLDANVPQYLMHMKERINAGRIHAPTQRVKAALRERLAKDPDAEIAWTLATIIQNGLANTELLFDAPSDSSRSKWDREDPAESYVTLAEALEIGFRTAQPKSDLWRRCGLSLARLRLLQGDWAAMNATLAKLGQQPVPDSRRGELPAPLPDWTHLADTWRAADNTMRSGNCAIEFQFEKDGQPLAGAHVLIKHPRDPALNDFTGIRVDTLLYATKPLEGDRYDTFGYRGNDRTATRYAVSDVTGRVRIEKLPKIPIAVEVLIPTANFAELGKSWDLVMELAPGDIRPTAWAEPNSIRSEKEGPSIAELKENETIHYPKLIVRSQLVLNVDDWTQVDADDFVLEWKSLKNVNPAVDRYEIEMMLTAPSQTPDMVTQQRVIRSTTEETIDTRWPVGKLGVGGQRLRPGNIYMFEVRGVDRGGNVLARLPRTRVWTPWPNRESLPPLHGDGVVNAIPIYDRVWWQGTTIHGDGTRTELREAVANYLQAGNDDFEYPYVELGKAWLQCLDGHADAGRITLKQLAQGLPEGNVARGTAHALVELLDDGKRLSKRLEFQADE
jgi:hypothetical protein